MIRRTLPFLLLGLAAGCSGGGGSGDRLDRDILVKSLSGPTSENGGVATFQIVLRSQPTSDVILNLSSDDATEGAVTPESLTFTRFNWNAQQTVTAIGLDDLEDDGNVVFHVVVGTPQTNDQKYGAIEVAPVPITNLDDETASIFVGPPSGATSEAGGEATISVRLTSIPSADVTIPVSVDDATEATLDAPALVFTTANWNTAQTITLSGADDDLADGNKSFIVTLAPATSTDAAYDGLTPTVAQLTLLNVDDEVAGITTTSTDAVTSEAGGAAGSGSFAVVLQTEPLNDVTLTFAVDDATEGELSVATLVFTSANWDVPQTVTVTGLDDMIADGAQSYQVDFMPTASNDPAYNNLAIASRDFVNADNESGGITVSPVIGVTTELGGDHTFTVVLDGQPADDVEIPISSLDVTEGTVDPPSLTFTSMNWNIPQTVTVSGVFDRERDGNRKYLVRFSPAVSNDPVYAGLRGQTVFMTSIDDGPAPTALIFDDGVASLAPAAVTTLGGFSLVTAADAADFEAQLPSTTIAIVELSSTLLPPSTQSALAAWISSGGHAVIAYHDLDGSPVLQSALGVTASAPHTTFRNIFRNPSGDPDLFKLSRQLATVITGSDVASDNGNELTLSGMGNLPVRFDTATGAGAVAVTNGGRTIVNGFAPDDVASSNVDGDSILDMRELYENEILYVTPVPVPPTPVYSSDFEADDGGLVVTGNAGWEWGTPATNPAFSGDKVWDTVLAGTYAASVFGCVTIEDLELPVAARWQMRLRYELESTFDFLTVESCDASGANCTTHLDTSATTTSYQLLDVDLSAFAGQERDLRWCLETDTSVFRNGISIDDVVVVEVQ